MQFTSVPRPAHERRLTGRITLVMLGLSAALIASVGSQSYGPPPSYETELLHSPCVLNIKPMNYTSNSYSVGPITGNSYTSNYVTG